jgi:O-antigen ligase
MAFFDRILFYVLLAVLAARPLISETFQPLEVSFLEALQNTGGPTPATTAWLDWITLFTAVIALVRRCRWRQHMAIGAGVALLAGAAVLSTTAAGDKSTALLAGSNLFIGALAGAALAALLEARWMRQLLLAALLATGATSAVKCLKQQFSENPLVQQEWEAVYKPRLVQQGFDPQDPLFVNFERRMKAGEVYGFLSHPNIEASCLMMWALVAAGVLGGWCAATLGSSKLAGSPRPTRGSAATLLWHRLTAGVLRPVRSPAATLLWHRLIAGVLRPVRSPAATLLWHRLIAGVLRPVRGSAATAASLAGHALFCLLLVAALWFTKSRGAAIAGFIGLAALVGLSWKAAWASRHAKRVLALLVAGYLALVSVGLTYGLVKGTLPSASLAFRWQYWTAAARALWNVPLTGLGRENFAYAYMLYKTPEATEEVKNPHNLWVSLLVELGPLGLVAGVVLCGAGLLVALRNVAPAGAKAVSAVSGQGAVSAERRRPRGADATHLWHRHLAGVLRPGQIPPATVAGAATVTIGVLVLHAVLSGTPLNDLGGVLIWVQDILLPWPLAFAAMLWLLAHSDSARWESWVTTGLCAALVAALVHGLVDFALLTPGGLAVFVLCAAGATRGAGAVEVERSRRAGIVPVVLGGALIVSYGFVLLDLRDATVARTKVRAAFQEAGAANQSIVEREKALARAAGMAEKAVARNPLDTSNYIRLATAREALARVYADESRAEDAKFTWHAAADAWQQAVERYPTNPRTRISCGKAWFEVWKQTGDPDAARRAREHFTEALRIDECRPVGEVVRLRPQEREPVSEYLRAIPQNVARDSAS